MFLISGFLKIRTFVEPFWQQLRKSLKMFAQFSPFNPDVIILPQPADTHICASFVELSWLSAYEIWCFLEVTKKRNIEKAK